MRDRSVGSIAWIGWFGLQFAFAFWVGKAKSVLNECMALGIGWMDGRSFELLGRGEEELFMNKCRHGEGWMYGTVVHIIHSLGIP